MFIYDDCLGRPLLCDEPETRSPAMKGDVICRGHPQQDIVVDHQLKCWYGHLEWPQSCLRGVSVDEETEVEIRVPMDHGTSKHFPEILKCPFCLVGPSHPV